MRKGLILVIIVLLCSLVFIGPCSASAGEEKKEKAEKNEEEKAHVYTNEDLEKYATEEQTEADAGEEVSYQAVEEVIQKINEPEQLRKWKEARLQAAEDKVRAVEMELDYLNKKRASIQNPFLPRPVPTEKDQEAEASMDNSERLERTDKQIEQAQEDLRIAEEELETLKRELRDAGI